MAKEINAKEIVPGTRIILLDSEHEVQSVIPGERSIKVITTIEFSGMTRYVQTTLDNHDKVTLLGRISLPRL